jgi:prephenate dehydrogenase
MPVWNRVSIVGVGLIGGSIGVDLLRRGLAREVIGIGRRPESLAVAERAAALSRGTTNLAEGVQGAELVIVCTPVGRIVDDVLAVAKHAPADAVITDAGSTKAAIVAELENRLPRTSRFVGSHPLAGGERSGPGAAVGDLFVGRKVVITPTAQTEPTALAVVEQFWQSLGALTVRMSPDEHDRAVATTSHLPHLAATALALATGSGELPLVARGWLDTTRIAAGDADLWQQIIAANREHVLAALEQFGNELAEIQGSIEAQDWARLEALLAEGKARREAAGRGA